MPERTDPAARLLLVSGDDAVIEEVLRLAIDCGTVTVVHEAAAAGRSWVDAALVVVGDDQAFAVARAALPRRPGVVLVGTDTNDPGVWRRAVAIGAEHVIFLPEARDWLMERMSRREGSARAALVVAVLGGRGGA